MVTGNSWPILLFWWRNHVTKIALINTVWFLHFMCTNCQLKIVLMGLSIKRSRKLNSSVQIFPGDIKGMWIMIKNFRADLDQVLYLKMKIIKLLWTVWRRTAHLKKVFYPLIRVSPYVLDFIRILSEKIYSMLHYLETWIINDCDLKKVIWSLSGMQDFKKGERQKH